MAVSPEIAKVLFAADYPELEFTAPDLQAHETNTKLAYDIKASIENKLSEIGIMNFWNTPNLATDSAETQWQYMMKLPALARCRCLQAIQAKLEALKIPEGLKNSCSGSDPDAAQKSANAFREAAEKLSEEMQLATWRAAALRLFAVADPCTYVCSLAGKGHQASMQLPHKVTQSMKELTLAQWPGWYETQFEKLVASPRCKHEKLLSDENTPAAGTCEGHAQDMLGIELYPDGVLGTFPERPTKKRRVGIPKGLEGYNVCVYVYVYWTHAN